MGRRTTLHASYGGDCTITRRVRIVGKALGIGAEGELNVETDGQIMVHVKRGFFSGQRCARIEL